MEQKSQKGLLTIIGILVLVIAVLVYFFYIKETGKAVPEANTSSATALSTATVSVGNALPIASNASLNGGSAIVLSPSPATTPVTVTGIVSDANGCNDIATINVAVYKQGATCATSSDANNDTCYFQTIASSSPDVTQCLGGTDTTANISHTFNFQYYADPGTWSTTITPIDIESVGTSSSASVALNETLAISVDPSLDYGAVAGGSNSTGDHTISASNLGNTIINLSIVGQDLLCNSGLNAQGIIPAGNLQYSSSSFAYGMGTSVSSTTPALIGSLNAPSQTSGLITKASYWQVAVPSGVRGICSGTLTVTATASSSAPATLEWAAIDSPLTTVPWDGAVSGCATLPTAGGATWRLPTKDELAAKYALTNSTPAGFQAARYWSGTEGAVGYAWYYDMQYGNSMAAAKADLNWTRCVR